MLRKALLSVAILTAVCAGIHTWLVSNDDRISATFLLVYLFFFVLTGGLLLLLNYVKKISPDKVGLTFMAASTFKMLLSLGFLVPFILNGGDHSKFIAINFLIPYFVLFVVEMYWVFKILKK